MRYDKFVISCLLIMSINGVPLVELEKGILTEGKEKKLRDLIFFCV